MTEKPEEHSLPPELEAVISKALDDGFYLHRTLPDGDGNSTRTGIGWRPGLPNPLAEFIIAYCTHRMMLELDGHKFWIEPQGTGDT